MSTPTQQPLPDPQTMFNLNQEVILYNQLRDLQVRIDLQLEVLSPKAKVWLSSQLLETASRLNKSFEVEEETSE